jgi:hypothetical protein
MIPALDQIAALNSNKIELALFAFILGIMPRKLVIRLH